LTFDIPRVCTIYAQFSWAVPAADTIFAFEASIDGVNFFQVGGPMEFSAPNGNIIKVDMPGCMQMRMNLIHMTGLSGPVLNVTWAVFDDNGLT
jgi:hypothetical protein